MPDINHTLVSLLTTVAAVAVAWGVFRERLDNLRKAFEGLKADTEKRFTQIEGRVEALISRTERLQYDVTKLQAEVLANEKIADKTGAHRPLPPSPSAR